MVCSFVRALRVQTLPILPYIFCLRHNCFCRLQPVDVDFSGFSCVDYSPSGKQRGIFGRTFTKLLAILAFHRASRTRVLLLENVPEFQMGILHLLMADMYEMQEYYMTPADIACSYLSRMRVFVVLYVRGCSSIFWQRLV